MKILLVIPTVHGGGAEQVAAVLAREWARAHELRVLAWHVGERQLDFGVPVEDLRLPASPGWHTKATMLVRRVGRVRACVAQWQPDLVLAFMDEAGLVCSAAAWRDGWADRLIVSMHHNPRWLSRARRALLALAYRVPAKVVGVSAGVCREMVASLHLPAQRVTHIPNPLPPETSLDTPATAVAAALTPGYVLFAGRLDRHTKGLDVLLDAWSRLDAPHPPLMIVGEGADRGWLEQEIRRRKLDDVHCLGWQADLLPFYRRAGVFVMCSRFEGWSNVLMEAIGQGCPVVASDCPYGPAEILGAAHADLLVPVADAAALACAIGDRLALDTTARAVLGVALRERAQVFEAAVVAGQWLALARSLPGRLR